MLTRVWDEMDYRIDVCRISKGGNIEHLLTNVKKLGEFISISINKIWYLLRSLFIVNFRNVPRTYE
jgi:hypothetical protein